MPRYNHDIVGACQAIQVEAEALAGENYPLMLGRVNGGLDFITSPDNGGMPENRLISENGKLKTLQIFYDQRTKSCQISDEINNVCDDDGTTPVRKEALVTLDEAISTPVRYFSNDEMVILCKQQSEFIRSRLFNDLRAAREFFSEKILATLDGYAGKILHWDGQETDDSGVVSPVVPLLIDDSGQDIPLPGNYTNILMDYTRMQLSGIPAIIGQGYFEKFMRLNEMACCNTSTPYGMAVEGANAAFFLDQAANDVFVNNHVIVLPFGIVKLVTFNKNDNIGINNELEQHITIPDPAGYPFRWNLDFKWDCSLERWKYTYSLEYTIFNVWQADSFAGAGEAESPDTSPDCVDELDGLTGVFKYHITRL